MMRGLIDDEIAARFDVLRDGTVRVSLYRESFVIELDDLAKLFARKERLYAGEVTMRPMCGPGKPEVPEHLMSKLRRVIRR